MRALLCAGVMAMAAMAPGWAANDPLSDSDLASRANTLFSGTETPADRVLGIHNGVLVIIDVRCSDLCPANTIRIIHYMGGVEAACKQTGGDLINIVVPRGLSTGPEKFCIPHVLASRKTYADKPYQR